VAGDDRKFGERGVAEPPGPRLSKSSLKQLREDPETNLEAIARMAFFTTPTDAEANQIGKPRHERHHLRKHGSATSYGQTKEPK
jgi:hypothetical protein